MPHFKFSNVNKKDLKDFLNLNLEKIVKITSCSKHYLNFRINNDEFVTDDNKSINEPIYVEINWFERGEGVKKAIVDLMIQYFIKEKKLNSLLVVRFLKIEHGDLFDNDIMI